MNNTNILLYPLRLEALGAALLLYGFGSVLFVLDYEFRAYHEFTHAVWLAYSGAFILIFCMFLFEYGLEICEATMEGKSRPPLFNVTLLSNLVFRFGRLTQQVVLALVFVGLGLLLKDIGYGYAATLLWLFFLLVFPASLIVNLLTDSMLELLNPLLLWQTALRSRWHYLLALLVFLPMLALFIAGLKATIVQFLLGFPLWLYCSFLFFHLLGLAVLRNKAEFFSTADFADDRTQAAAVSDNLQDLNRVLSNAYEELRAGREQNALASLERLLVAGGWQDFEKVFAYVEAWPFANAGIHLVGRYLPHAVGRQRHMRALELLAWCLQRQPDFAIRDAATLESLVEQAATPPQYRAVLSAVENLLSQQSATALSRGLKLRCLDLAGTRLRDEKRHAALQASFTRAD